MMNDAKQKKKQEKKGFQALYKSIKKQSEKVLEQTIKKSGIKFAYQEVRGDILDSLFGTFNKNLSSVNKLLDNPRENILSSISYSGEPFNDFGKLYTVIAECEKIIYLLEEEKKQKTIPYKLKNRLDSLKEDFKKIGIFDLGIIKNIEKSIELFESGDTLCSVLFASRVISYTIDKFDIDEELIKENEIRKNKKGFIELIVEECIKKGIIDKDKKEYQSNFLLYIKLARNLLIHKLLFFPEAAECLGILSNSINLLKLKKKFDQFSENTN